MHVIKGKALLVVTKEGKSFDVHPFVQSASRGATSKAIAADDLGMVFYCGHLPCMSRMKDGDVIRIAVTYAISYFCDYWGECDTDIEIVRYRVLRRQPYRKERYVSKAVRAAAEARRSRGAAIWKNLTL